MKKSIAFILLLLAIVAAQVWVLYGNFKKTNPQKISLDEQVFALDLQENIKILPFAFEVDDNEIISRELDALEQELAEPSEVQNWVKEAGMEETEKISTVQESEAVINNVDSAMIAVVIDDVGLSVPFTNKISALGKPITVAMLPYGASNSKQAQQLKNAGFDIMVHVPMMPHVPADLAPITLSPEMDKAELQEHLNKMIDRFEDVNIVGINNHMGSLLTEKTSAMESVMEVLKKRGMFFLDSKTTSKSVAGEAAEKAEVVYASRDVFLDNKNEYDYIMGQFKTAEKVAQKKGYAVVIGHPHAETYKALVDWVKDVENRGFKLVKMSDLLVLRDKK